MRTIRAFLIRLAGSFGMQRRDGEFAEEIESLLEMHTEENRRAGMAPAEARRRAVLEIGGVEPLKEAYRDRIGLPLLGALAQDLRYACRALWKSPGFTSIAVLSLALGIGANTAIFTLVNDILLKWLPVREPEQLVALGSNRQNGPYLYCYKIYTELRDRNTVFSGLFARNWFEFYFDAGGETETLNVEMVSGNYFETLGVNAYIGRTLSPEDDRTPGAHPVAVLSYDFWVSRFGADPGAIGKTVHIQGHPFTIVGVTPPSFFGVNSGMSQPIRVPWSMATVLRPPSGSWNPFDEPGKGFRHSEPYQLFARLKPGISIEQAQAALEPLFASIRREHADALDWVNIPGTSNQWPAVVSATDYRRFVDRRLAVAPVGRGFAGLKVRFRQPLLALMALVGVLLLISCSTMANLLLARSTARQREIAVRMALGAGRFRLICQSLLESLLLAVSGGALGVLVAWWGAGALAAIIGPSAAPDFSLTALSLKVTPDLGVLAFTVAVSLLTSLLVGLAPSLHAARTTVIEALKGKGAALAGDRSHMTLRKSLIVTEVGLCVLLLAAAGLFVRTLKSLRDVHTTGFDTSRLIQMWISPDPYSRLTAEQKQQYYTELMRRLEALPGVRSAARSKALLMMSDYYGWRTVVEGREPRAIENIPWNEVSSRFFETVGVPILSGRVWSTQDDSRPTHEAVISQSLAKYFFGDRSPIGETLSTWKPGVRFQIVGVIGDMRYGRLRDDDPRAVYVAPGEFAGANNVLVGTIGDPTRLIAALEREAKALNHEAYVHPVKTVQQQLDDLLVQDSLVARLATLFGAFAAFEAAIGLYGVVAFSVARRTREIGVRVALGATRGAILSLVLREILVVAAIGVAVGISCALVLSRFTASLLFGVAATDPLALCGAALLMATVALSAAYLPARRAMRLDPMAALREE